MSEEVKDAISRRVNRVATAWEPRLREQARQQFEIDRDKLLDVLDEQKALKQTIDWQTVEKKWQTVMQDAGARWREAFIPVIRGLVVDQAERYNVEFGYSFDVRNLYSEEWLLDYTMPFAEAVEDTTGDALNELLTQAQAEGWSVPQTQEHLRQMFEQYIKGAGTPEQFDWFKDRMPAYRTEMIARTESVRASSRGSQALHEAWGVEFKEWWTTEDDRRCFPAGTLVLTRRGQKPIENVQVGDEVWTRHGWKSVINTMSRKYLGPMCTVETDDGPLLTATADHPIWESRSQSWVEVSKLKVGDCLQLADNTLAKVRRTHNFRFSHSDRSDPVFVQVLGSAGLSGGVLMPIFPICFKGNMKRRKEKVYRISSDLGFLDIGNPSFIQGKANSSFNAGFPIIATIAGKATEDTINGWTVTELFAAVLTNCKMWWVAACDRAVVVFRVMPNTEALAATFASGIASSGCTALPATSGVSIGHGFADLKLLSTNRASFGDKLGSACFVVAFSRTVFGWPIFGALGLRWGKIKLASTHYAVKVLAKSLSFLRAKFEVIPGNRHSRQLLTKLEQLYHRLSAKSSVVYNLTVQDVPEFYANGILVHNCPFCAEMHGKVIPIKNAFFPLKGHMNVEVGEGEERRTISIDFNYEQVNGPPLHTSCRCVILPVVTTS